MFPCLMLLSRYIVSAGAGGGGRGDTLICMYVEVPPRPAHPRTGVGGGERRAHREVRRVCLPPPVPLDAVGLRRDVLQGQTVVGRLQRRDWSMSIDQSNSERNYDTIQTSN